MPSQPKKQIAAEQSSPSPDQVTSGDPSEIALRVIGINSVIQFRGTFERYAGMPDEKILIYYPPVDFSAQIDDENRVIVTLYFTCAMAVEGSAAAELLKTAAGTPTKEALPFPTPAQGLRAFADAGFAVEYQLIAGQVPNDANLQKFADINGKLNLTPYWREFLDTSMRRAGLPNVISPVFHKAAETARSQPTK